MGLLFSLAEGGFLKNFGFSSEAGQWNRPSELRTACLRLSSGLALWWSLRDGVGAGTHLFERWRCLGEVTAVGRPRESGSRRRGPCGLLGGTSPPAPTRGSPVLSGLWFREQTKADPRPWFEADR